MAQALVTHVVQLIRPETPLTQMETVKVRCVVPKHCTKTKKQLAARPDVILTFADLYYNSTNDDKVPELEEALARDNFQLFAGVQGVRNYVGNRIGDQCG